jgi:hypothetical protein
MPFRPGRRREGTSQQSLRSGAAEIEETSHEFVQRFGEVDRVMQALRQQRAAKQRTAAILARIC